MDLAPLHDMGPDAFAELLEEADPKLWPALLRERFRTHKDEFARYCWPERFDLPFNELHHDLFAKGLVPGWKERRERRLTIRDAIAAPRGFAKSAISSFAEIAHDIAYGSEAFIVLVSSEQGLALDFSRDLLHECQQKDTPFARLYGPFATKGGIKGWEVSVRGGPSIAIRPRSEGSAVRGIKHPTRGIRPTKVVLDDAEDKDRVRNPEQRALWMKWLRDDVLKLADRRGGTYFRLVGTVLHPDSGLNQLLRDPGWRSKRWQAIQRWPHREDLWKRCHAIWSNLTLGEHRRTAALAFYRANREAMEEGAELLDPASKTLFDLYELIWSEGYASFLREYQNDPVDPSAAIFHSPAFARFWVDGDALVVPGPDGKVLRRVKLRDLRIVGRWDPATGSVGGDFAAIAILGRDKHGYTYVLDVWMRRAKVSEQLAAAWTLAERWNCHRMIVEGNGFQQLVAEPYPREREQRKADGRYWRLELRPEVQTGNKELRIATLEPDISNGWMQFNTSISQEVLGQFDQFPTGDHDDGPDAIHAAWAELGGRPAEMVR